MGEDVSAFAPGGGLLSSISVPSTMVELPSLAKAVQLSSAKAKPTVVAKPSALSQPSWAHGAGAKAKNRPSRPTAVAKPLVLSKPLSAHSAGAKAQKRPSVQAGRELKGQPLLGITCP